MKFPFRKKQAEPIEQTKESVKKGNVLEKGARTAKDFFAPPSFDRSNEEYLKVGNKYVRSFVMQGFPANVSVGWLDHLFNYDGDMDTVIYVEPADERAALDELTAKITQFEAQLQMEVQKGNIRNITRLKNTIAQLYEQRERLEQNYENLFYIQILSNLYANSLEDLNKETQRLDNQLRGRRIYHMPIYLRQDDGYKSALPFGKTYLPDMFRNFNSGALTACFPFYNSEISHKTGVLCGVNLATMTPIFIDFFDRKILDTSNFTVIGKSGTGKTYFLKMLSTRMALKGVRVVFIDPEGEYKKLTAELGGKTIVIAPNSNLAINPFDLEEEEEEDGKKAVNIKGKVADILNLIGVMAGGLTAEQKSLVSYVVAKLYEDRGITEDPNSLYEEPYFDEKTRELVQGKKKRMPTFSDFHNELEKMAEKEKDVDLKKLVNALRMFKKGGVYDLFDCETSPELQNFHHAPIVTFDVSQLEESMLRPIGMYIALSWVWEKFAKKNPYIKKFIVFDEGWMMVSKNMAGSEFTGAFLETMARRIRKRNGGILVASQNFAEFAKNEYGRAVLTNSSINILLRQDAADIDEVQNVFKLSDGERNFLLSAKRGEMLVKIGQESTVAYAMSFPFEHEMIEKSKKAS